MIVKYFSLFYSAATGMMQCPWGIQVSLAVLATCPGGLAPRLPKHTVDVNKTLNLEDVNPRFPDFLNPPFWVPKTSL